MRVEPPVSVPAPALAKAASSHAGLAGDAGDAGRAVAVVTPVAVVALVTAGRPGPAGHGTSRRGCPHPDRELAVDGAGHHGFVVHVGSGVGLGVDDSGERRRSGAQLLPCVACVVGGP